MAGIFISYRRSSASTTTYRLVDDLRRAFGPEQIFLDVESIEPGIPFAHAIQKSLGKSSVALIMIDPQWLTVEDKHGQPRLQDAEDWVRQEVRAAIKSSARVIPVLIEGAQMPEREDLPTDITALAQLQAFNLLPSQAHWAFDVSRLIDQIAAIDAGLKRIDTVPVAAGSATHYSYKVLAGFVIYGLITLTATVEGWDDSDDYLGAILFLLLAGGLFLVGLQDIRKGMTRGKKGAIVGLAFSALSVLGHSISYSMMLSAESVVDGAAFNPPLAGSNVQPATSPQRDGPSAQSFAGSWISQQGVRLQIWQSSGDVTFAEYNALGGQVGQGEGSVSGSQLRFDYYNSLMGISATGTATLNGQTMQLTLVEPNSGQQFSYIYYRQ